VWEDYPDCTRIVPEITQQNLSSIQDAISGSAATDVTGGMLSKVTQSIKMVQDNPGLEVLIFSGEKSGWLEEALLGASRGTVIRAA
jgi:isopentenyl phosphate kinase